MYPESTALEITAVAVAVGLLCIGAQFLESRRQRKEHDPNLRERSELPQMKDLQRMEIDITHGVDSVEYIRGLRDADEVVGDMQNGKPLWEIEADRDQGENQEENR